MGPVELPRGRIVDNGKWHEPSFHPRVSLYKSLNDRSLRTEVRQDRASHQKGAGEDVLANNARIQRSVRHRLPNRLDVGPLEISRSVPPPAPHCSSPVSDMVREIGKWDAPYGGGLRKFIASLSSARNNRSCGPCHPRSCGSEWGSSVSPPRRV